MRGEEGRGTWEEEGERGRESKRKGGRREAMTLCQFQNLCLTLKASFCFLTKFFTC